jgi:hypothetical protein
MFRALSIVLGAPSLAGALYFGWASIQLHLSNPGPLPPSSGSSNQLIALIEASGRLVGGIFRVLGNLGEWLVMAVFVISTLLFLFAVLLWFTATGLAHGKLWARVTAVLCGLALLGLVGIVALLRAPVQ